jgi:ABC-2 type transport system permease protein
MFVNTLRITTKDLRLLTRDRRALVVLLALPLVLIAVIGSSSGRFAGNDDQDASGSEVQNEPTSGESAKSPNRVYRSIVPGFVVLFVFFVVNIMGRSFIQERELGTLQRLRTAPVTNTSIMLGKTLPFFVISMTQTGLLLLAGVFLFGMNAGPRPWLMIPLAVCTSLAATSLGLAFASFVKTDAQVSAWGNLIVLGTAGISGCLVPRHWMPELSQKVSLLMPHAWALTGYREILAAQAPSVAPVLTCCLVLLGFSTAFFIAGSIGFRRM